MIGIPFFLHETLDCVFASRASIFMEDQIQAITYERCRRDSIALATRLRDLGILAGDRVLLNLDGSAHIASGLFAASAIGAISVPIGNNERNLLAVPHKTLAPSAIVSLSQKTPILTENLVAIELESVGTGDKGMATNWPLCPLLIDLDPAVIMMTSGSTQGTAKGVVMSHNAIIGACESIGRYLEISQADRILMCSPISFDYGLYQLIIAALRGACVVVPSPNTRRYVVELFDVIQQMKITVLPLVPTFARIVIPLWRRLKLTCPNLRLVTFTGGPFPVHLVEDLRALFPNSKIVPMYGITEAKRVSYLPSEEVGSKPASIGRAIPNCRVRVVRPDGRVTAVNEVGEFQVESRTIMNGYFSDPEETAQRLIISPNGQKILFTGDLGYRDTDGDLFWVGRNDDIVKIDDVRISTQEVEAALRSIPQISDAAVSVFGTPSRPRLGACIVCSEPTAYDLILGRLGDLVGLKQMIPTRLVFLLSMPMTAHGKIDYQEVRRVLEGNDDDLAGAD